MVNKVTSKTLKQEDRMHSNGKYISLSGARRLLWKRKWTGLRRLLGQWSAEMVAVEKVPGGKRF